MQQFKLLQRFLRVLKEVLRCSGCGSSSTECEKSGLVPFPCNPRVHGSTALDREARLNHGSAAVFQIVTSGTARKGKRLLYEHVLRRLRTC